MIVTAVLLGNLKSYSRPETPGLWNGEIAEGSLVRDLARVIGIPEGASGMAAVNGSLKSFDAPVPDGARVLFFSPMSGG